MTMRVLDEPLPTTPASPINATPSPTILDSKSVHDPSNIYINELFEPSPEVKFIIKLSNLDQDVFSCDSIYSRFTEFFKTEIKLYCFGIEQIKIPFYWNDLCYIKVRINSKNYEKYENLEYKLIELVNNSNPFGEGVRASLCLWDQLFMPEDYPIFTRNIYPNIEELNKRYIFPFL